MAVLDMKFEAGDKLITYVNLDREDGGTHDRDYVRSHKLPRVPKVPWFHCYFALLTIPQYPKQVQDVRVQTLSTW